jgi:hypothetical protein
LFKAPQEVPENVLASGKAENYHMEERGEERRGAERGSSYVGK